MLDFDYAKQMSKKLEEPCWATANRLKLKVVSDYPVDTRLSLRSRRNENFCRYCLNCVIRKDGRAVLIVRVNSLELF